MSVFGLERSNTAVVNIYDHSINLRDATRPSAEEITSDDADTVNSDGEGKELNRQGTRDFLRKEIARRKYSRWQEDETAKQPGVDEDDAQPEIRSSSLGKVRDKLSSRPRGRAAYQQKPRYQRHGENAFIDVLYENQRGSFICGVPLYSANSLLNFDPSGWQTSTYQDSAVNITNAQVPDPGWRWDWRSWYVDMSYDVDEEGWQYSFSFGNSFAWHGNQPWFHSFVRRRRWLRRRIKVIHHTAHGTGHDLREAHTLAPDYFTIHPSASGRNRSSSPNGTSTTRSSRRISHDLTNEDECNGNDNLIENIPALISMIKKASLDREKLVAIRSFIRDGGDELYYLADRILPIMNDFVHEASKHQLQALLLQSLSDTISTMGITEDGQARDGAERKVDNILRTIRICGVRSEDSELWQATQAKLTEEQRRGNDEISQHISPEPPLNNDAVRSHIEHETDDMNDDFQGIPKKARISLEPRIGRPLSEGDEHGDGDVRIKEKGKLTAHSKGKGKA